MKYLMKVFHKVNDYPMSIINKIAQQDRQSKIRRTETNENPNKVQLILPYSRKQGKKLITKMKKHIRGTLPENIQTMVAYKSKKLSTKFNIKDKTEFYHQYNLVYYGKCPNQTCTENYIGETTFKVKERLTIINVIRTHTY